MITPASLKATAKLVCVNAVLLENNIPPSSGKNVYVTQLLETDCFTAVSRELLYWIVEYCPDRLTNRLLKALLPHHERELNLSSCSEVTLMGLVESLKRCVHVQTLNLYGCSQLMHVDLFTFMRLTNIPVTTLILESINNVTDDIVHAVIKNLSQLVTLNISGCGAITDDVFLVDPRLQLTREMAKHPLSGEHTDYTYSLSCVDISGCSSLTSVAVRHLASLCGPHLKHINLAWTSIDCTALFYLSGYNFPSVIEFVLDEEINLQSERDLRTYLDELREIKALSETRHVEEPDNNAVHKEAEEESATGADQDIGTLDVEADQDIATLDAVNISIEDSLTIQHQPRDDLATVKCDVDKVTLNTEEAESGSAKVAQDPCGILIGDSQTIQHHPRAGSIVNIGNITQGTKTLKSGLADITQDSCESFVCSNDHLDFKQVVGEEHSVTAEIVVIDKKGHVMDNGCQNESCDTCSGFSVNDITSEFRNGSAMTGIKCDNDEEMVMDGLKSRCDNGTIKCDLIHSCDKVAASRKQKNYDTKNESADPLRISGKDKKCVSSSTDTNDTVGNHVLEMIDELHITSTDSQTDNDTTSNDANSFIEQNNDELQAATGEVKDIVNNIPEISASNEAPVTTRAILQAATGEVKDIVNDVTVICSSDGAPVTCTSQTDSRSEHTNKDQQLTERAKPKQNIFIQIFQPYLISINIANIKFLNRKLGRLCIEQFFYANKSIQRFELSWKGFTEELLKKVLPSLSDLREVGLEECTWVQTGGVAALGRECVKLTKINLRGAVFIKDMGMVPVLALQDLTQLSLAESEVTDVTLRRMSLMLATTLADLDLSWCEEITEKGLNDVCSKCSNLKRLTLRKCPASDLTLQLLAENCSRLEELYIESVEGVGSGEFSDIGVIAVAESLSQLQVLDVSWNLSITNVSVSSIMTHCGLLREAYMKGLKRITCQPFVPIICVADGDRTEVPVDGSSAACGKGLHDNQPRRSTVFASNLRVLDLEFSDLVDDRQLMEIVNTCRGSLHVTDYYGQKLEPDEK